MLSSNKILLGLALLAQGVGAFYAPHEGEWQQLEVVPVPIKSAESRGRSLPRFIRLPSGSTMLCSGTPSKACQKILEKTQSNFPDDEGWAYGDGYYSMGWPDIDDNADTGIIGMPYDVRRPAKSNTDIAQNYLTFLSQTKPTTGHCLACATNFDMGCHSSSTLPYFHLDCLVPPFRRGFLSACGWIHSSCGPCCCCCSVADPLCCPLSLHFFDSLTTTCWVRTLLQSVASSLAGVALASK